MLFLFYKTDKGGAHPRRAPQPLTSYESKGNLCCHCPFHPWRNLTSCPSLTNCPSHWSYFPCSSRSSDRPHWHSPLQRPYSSSLRRHNPCRLPSHYPLLHKHGACPSPPTGRTHLPVGHFFLAKPLFTILLLYKILAHYFSSDMFLVYWRTLFPPQSL